MTNDDGLTPILIEGREVGRVRLAPVNAVNRREKNLGLGVVQLPSLLKDYQPQGPTPPQARFLSLLRAYCEAMNGGQRNQLDENALARLYMETHGVAAALHHQVRHASGEALCGICSMPYSRHKFERAILDPEGQPYIKRLCNGDLVKL